MANAPHRGAGRDHGGQCRSARTGQRAEAAGSGIEAHRGRVRSDGGLAGLGASGRVPFSRRERLKIPAQSRAWGRRISIVTVVLLAMLGGTLVYTRRESGSPDDSYRQALYEFRRGALDESLRQVR